MGKLFFFLCLGLNLVLAYNFFLGQEGLGEYLHRRELKADLVQELEQVQKQNLELSQRIRLLQDDVLYLEKVVRSELHFVQEDEVLYVRSELEQQSAEKR